jgi:hypothetical protein
MERYGLSAERAWDLLVRVSSTTNSKLRLVAHHLVETGELLGDVPSVRRTDGGTGPRAAS